MPLLRMHSCDVPLPAFAPAGEKTDILLVVSTTCVVVWPQESQRSGAVLCDSPAFLALQLAVRLPPLYCQHVRRRPRTCIRPDASTITMNLPSLEARMDGAWPVPDQMQLSSGALLLTSCSLRCTPKVLPRVVLLQMLFLAWSSTASVPSLVTE